VLNIPLLKETQREVEIPLMVTEFIQNASDYAIKVSKIHGKNVSITVNRTNRATQAILSIIKVPL
jgi:two-component sensor histidine kinase